MRHTLEIKTVNQIKTAKRQAHLLIRDRYITAMEQMGYSTQEAIRCFADVYDIAILEQRAA